MDQGEILDYYETCREDYFGSFGAEKHFSMHFGLHDGDYDRSWKEELLFSLGLLSKRELQAAVMNRIDHVIQVAGIQEGERVLDAGCGMGGTSVRIAGRTGADVVGIDLDEDSLEYARKLAQSEGVEEKTRFQQRDFEKFSYENSDFDVILGIESICYSSDKESFLQAAKKGLKKGGRIAVSDGFRRKKELTRHEEKTVRELLEGWAIEEVPSLNEFHDKLQRTGFRNIEMVDLKKEVLPTSRYLHRLSIGSPTFRRLKGDSRYRIGNSIAVRRQYQALRQDLWTQATFYGETG